MATGHPLTGRGLAAKIEDRVETRRQPRPGKVTWAVHGRGWASVQPIVQHNVAAGG